MYFNSIKIRNFKGIEQQEIHFRQGMNILLGENGAGKTSVLEAMVIAMGDYFNGIAGVEKKGIQREQIRFQTHQSGQATAQIEYCNPTVIDSRICLSKEIAGGRVYREDETSQSRTRYSGKVIADYAKEQTNKLDAILPVLCYFSTKRLASPKSKDFGVTSKNKLSDRRCGYIGCMDDALDRDALEAWCLKMEQVGFKENRPISEYERFKEIVSKFMKAMNDMEQEPKISYSRVFDDMTYVENGVETPVKYLSAGYQSLLWIVMTIAFRLCQLNPSIDDYRTVPGIVMIDEIDLHLHPRWQWKILDALTDVFPNIQFVVTTHAPIVISSCKNGNLILLDEKQTVTYLEEAYAYSVDDVLELRQGSPSIPKKLTELYRTFDKAFTEENYDEAERVYREMKSRFGETNSEVKKAAFELGLE